MKMKTKEVCSYDILSLGEVMLRLDSGEERVRNTRQFKAWEGGGEYNVARGLHRCFNQRAAIVTALADNDIGYLIEDLIYQGGVDMTYLKHLPSDERGLRNGLNFTERGFGFRSSLGTSDRGDTAISRLKPGDIDWHKIFGKDGVRWFHTGGVFAALSDSSKEVALEAVKIAKQYGTKVSYDPNYRASLWSDRGGVEAAQELNREISNYADVIMGMSLDSAIIDLNLNKLNQKELTNIFEKTAAKFPDLKVITTTLREVKSATINDWRAIAWSPEQGLVESSHYKNLELLDRVGGGDSFASGLIYGLLKGGALQEAVDYGAAHGVLAMTTPGDTSSARLDEVEQVMKGAGEAVIR
ncbi:sugar kinase [Lentisphaera profundi]|uniref:Sugar kinase n=2 Tax=Lentisphaera profundi TaxID=1658616 RepID=A0ABY7VU31_9BACT|nr:sugar kinase [Lentisphaera profundi]WDE96402.1 sugar kinase [Lentisphaera profundi]